MRALHVGALALLCASAIHAQVSARYAPIRIGQSQQVFGPGRTVGFWIVSLSNEGQTEERLSWEKILSFAPTVPWYPSDLAQDLASRQAASAPANRIGAIWDAAAPSAGTATGLAGTFLKSPQMQYVGMGLILLSAGVKLVRKSAPDPTPYFSKMLPAEVVLQPGTGATFYAASGLVHKVSVLTATIPASVVILPPGTGNRSQRTEIPTWNNPARHDEPTFEVSAGARKLAN
jgi:hypothetical protein